MVTAYLRNIPNSGNCSGLVYNFNIRRKLLDIYARRRPNWRSRFTTLYRNAAWNHGTDGTDRIRLCQIPYTKRYKVYDCYRVHPSNFLLRYHGRAWHLVWRAFSRTESRRLYCAAPWYRWRIIYHVNANQN